MNNNSRMRRREIVQRVREEGRQAALAGLSRQVCPYEAYNSDAFQWSQGYEWGREELEAITKEVDREEPLDPWVTETAHYSKDNV